MSRIGNRKIVIPEGVSVELNDNIVKVTGKLGELSLDLPNVIKMEITDNVITLYKNILHNLFVEDIFFFGKVCCNFKQTFFCVCFRTSDYIVY